MYAIDNPNFGIYRNRHGTFTIAVSVGGIVRRPGTFTTLDLAREARDREVAKVMAREGLACRTKPHHPESTKFGTSEADDAELRERIAAVREAKREESESWTVPVARCWLADPR